MNRQIVCLLSLILALFCLSITAFALTDGDWEYKLFDTYAVVTGYTGSDEEVTTPSTIHGVPVTKIADNAFTRSSIKRKNEFLKIVISEGVTEIGEKAFDAYYESPKSVQEVSLPSTLKKIGKMAFFYCESLRQINFPAELERISEYAFEGCKSLEQIDLSKCEKVTIGKAAFSGCSSVKEVRLPEKNAQSLNVSSFAGLSKMTKINLPIGITELPDYVFSGCNSLRGFYVPSTVKYVGSDALRFDQKYLIIPYGVERFWSFSAPITISIPETAKVEKIDKDALVYCSSGSDAEAYCKKHNVSYILDPSVNYKIQVVYNGERISFDAPPIIENGRTLVPLRAIFETLGAKVDWDGKTQTVTATKGTDVVVMQIGNKTMKKNGVDLTIDVAPKLSGGRTLVPVRAIAESFDCEVNWIGYANIVEIKDKT